MAVEKSLYQTPVGIAEEAEAMLGEPDIEIEIVDPEEVTLRMDGLEIEIDPDAVPDFYENLAEVMDADEIESMASDLVDDIKQDIESRKDWEEAYKNGLTLMGLKYEERTEPWDGACGVFHPMITEAVVRFQAETIMETFPAQGPVKTQIIGRETVEKEQAARRIKNHMNYELTEKMTEFRPEHERMLWNLPATGSAFKKVYYDPSLQRQISVFVPAEDIILPYGASNLDTCERVTHRMKKTENEIKKLMAAGFYKTIDLPDPSKEVNELQKKKDEETGFSAINDDRYEIYESHVSLNLSGYEDEDGIALPYVVTVLSHTGDVLAIRRNYYEDDPTKAKRNHFVHYQYIPGFGAYGFGLFHLIGGYAKSATSIMRQLVDAGTLANLPGGLKARGLRIKGDDTPIAPGEFRDVDVGSGSIRDNIMPLPYKEPSSVLSSLLDKIVEEGRRFAATADMKISDMSAQAPVGTTLALLERMLKVMSAVQARVHFSFKQELKLLAAIIRDYTEDEYAFDVDDADRNVKKADYDHVDIIPVSDPNAATLSQRVVQYQAVIQLAQQAPQVYDIPALHRQMLEVLGIKNAAKLVPLPDDETPKDPLTENMNILKMKPVKAFMYQDHNAHITAHVNMLQDPSMAQMIGQNPNASMIQAAAQAHIAEHLAFAYRRQVQEAVGVPLPHPDDKIPEEAEVELSRMVAEGTQLVLMRNQAQEAQAQAQQAAQDPVMQIEQQKLQIQQSEVQRKAMKDQAEMQLAQQKLAMEQQRAMLDAQVDQGKLQLEAQKLEAEGVKTGIDMEFKRDKMSRQDEKDGFNAMVNMMKGRGQ